MRFYKFFENPKIYNLITKIFSLNNKRLKKCLTELINIKPQHRILDVGCGTGKYAIFSCDYTGVDSNQRYIDYAKKHHQGVFLTMNGADLKFPDNTFDFVINISTLHHLLDQTARKLILEMKRVCKRGGKIYIIDAVYPKNLLGYILFKLDRGRYQKTFEKLSNFLSEHGFEVITDNLGKTFPYQWAVFSYKE